MTESVFITAIDPVPGQLALQISWRDGTASRVDLKEFIYKFDVLTPLCDVSFFAQVKVGEWGLDVGWPNDIGLSASTLKRLAQEQAVL